MFGRIQPLNNNGSSEDGDDDPVVGDFHLRRRCREFLSALQACAEILSVDETEMTVDRPDLKTARETINCTLQEFRSLRPSCAVGLKAKIEAWLALEELFGEEDSRVIGFAHELVREAYSFLSADETGECKSPLRASGGISGQSRQSRLSFPRFLWFSW